MIGKHINGTTQNSKLVDGVEFETDKDFETSDDGVLLTITTGSGTSHDFFGPELDDVDRRMSTQAQLLASISPGIEKLAPRRFRLRLTEIQERLLHQPFEPRGKSSDAKGLMPSSYDADPAEIVSVPGEGSMTLRTAVRRYIEARDGQAGTMLTLVFREQGKEPSSFEPKDLDELARRDGFL